MVNLWVITEVKGMSKKEQIEEAVEKLGEGHECVFPEEGHSVIKVNHEIRDISEIEINTDEIMTFLSKGLFITRVGFVHEDVYENRDNIAMYMDLVW